MLDSVVASFSYSDLHKLYTNRPSFNRVGRIICEQYVSLGIDRSLDLVSLDATAKYEKLIQQYGDIVHTLPQKFIASFLGISPRSFSRLKKELCFQ